MSHVGWAKARSQKTGLATVDRSAVPTRRSCGARNAWARRERAPLPTLHDANKSIRRQPLVVDVQCADIAVVDVGIEIAAVGEADLGAHRAVALVGPEVHVECLTRLDALADPVAAPFVVFLGAELDRGIAPLVDDLEFPFRRGRPVAGQNKREQQGAHGRHDAEGCHSRLPFRRPVKGWLFRRLGRVLQPTRHPAAG